MKKEKSRWGSLKTISNRLFLFDMAKNENIRDIVSLSLIQWRINDSSIVWRLRNVGIERNDSANSKKKKKLTMKWNVERRNERRKKYEERRKKENDIQSDEEENMTWSEEERKKVLFIIRIRLTCYVWYSWWRK